MTVDMQPCLGRVIVGSEGLQIHENWGLDGPKIMKNHGLEGLGGSLGVFWRNFGEDFSESCRQDRPKIA